MKNSSIITHFQGRWAPWYTFMNLYIVIDHRMNLILKLKLWIIGFYFIS